MRIFVLALALSFPVNGTVTIDRVQVTPLSFNPSLGDTVTLTFQLSGQAQMTAEVIDRDGYVVRLLHKGLIRAGVQALPWNGTDESGAVVADEAYSFRLSVDDTVAYFPADRPAKHATPKISYYDQRGGTVVYNLAVPSRVHMQAGAREVVERKRLVKGGLLKTIVNRQPRPAGTVIESWKGYDESGTIYVPSVKEFVMSLATTELPDNSVIAHGNRDRPFLDYANRRVGSSKITASAHDHRHHAGLTALDDTSPPLAISASVTNASINLIARPTGPAAERFIQQPGRIFVFVDYETVVEMPSPKTREVSIQVPKVADRAGQRVVTVNWVSDYGPVAANSTLLSLASSERAR